MTLLRGWFNLFGLIKLIWLHTISKVHPVYFRHTIWAICAVCERNMPLVAGRYEWEPQDGALEKEFGVTTVHCAFDVRSNGLIMTYIDTDIDTQWQRHRYWPTHWLTMTLTLILTWTNTNKHRQTQWHQHIFTITLTLKHKFTDTDWQPTLVGRLMLYGKYTSKHWRVLSAGVVVKTLKYYSLCRASRAWWTLWTPQVICLFCLVTKNITVRFHFPSSLHRIFFKLSNYYGTDITTMALAATIFWHSVKGSWALIWHYSLNIEIVSSTLSS